jgi:hypothetical protein
MGVTPPPILIHPCQGTMSMMGLDSNAKPLTLQQMKDEINAGRGILHNGEVITELADLPNAVKLAAGDPEAIKKARADADARQKALDTEKAEIDKIEAAAKAKPSEPEAKPEALVVPVADEPALALTDGPRYGRKEK